MLVTLILANTQIKKLHLCVFKFQRLLIVKVCAVQMWLGKVNNLSKLALHVFFFHSCTHYQCSNLSRQPRGFESQRFTFHDRMPLHWATAHSYYKSFRHWDSTLILGNIAENNVFSDVTALYVHLNQKFEEPGQIWSNYYFQYLTLLSVQYFSMDVLYMGSQKTR